MIKQIKCLHKNYKKDDQGKWELTDKKTESVNQKQYSQIVRNLDLERDTRRAYGYQPFGHIKKATFYGFDRHFKTTYEFMEHKQEERPVSKTVKLSNYQFKVQRVGSNLYRFIPLNFNRLPTVHPFITVDNSYWLLQCKPKEVEGYIVSLSKKLGTMDLESMNHFYNRLAKDSSSPLQCEPVEAYHKPSEFILSWSKQQQAADGLERGKFHHHLYKRGTFWDFLAGVWWGDHFNN